MLTNLLINEMKKLRDDNISVLFLARWYPNRYDPMGGLFIQRHAEAVSQYCKTGVVYVHSVDSEKIQNHYEPVSQIINGVNTICVYYNKPKINIPLLTQIIKLYKFYRANFIGIKKIVREQGDFSLLHIHILTRLGLIALYYKLFKNKPYLISEHWSRYLPATGDFKGIFRRLITKLVVKKASFVTTVTENLANAMKSHGLVNDNYVVLDNVVDHAFYQSESIKIKKKDIPTFINVSCFTERAKNLSGLLRVIKAISDQKKDFVFNLVGEGEDLENIKAYASELGINRNNLVFKGLLEGEALVNEMANANLMVVFSNYENLPVVINESFVLGVPVISTNVGGIKEILNSSNGVLIDRKDEKALEKLLINYLEGNLKFKTDSIRKEFRFRFSPEKIGSDIFEFYQRSLLN